MQEVIGILAGALLSGSASLCIGVLLFRRLGLKLGRAEYISLAFVAGSACFSQIIFLFASIHLARKAVFIGIAVFALGIAASRSRRAPGFVSSPSLPRGWKWLSAVLFASFGIVYLANALAPEMSPDGSAYHLPFVARYLAAHGFEKIANNFYAGLSQGIELLFLPAVSVGGNSSAALLHFAFLLDLPLLMFCYGRRFGFPVPAVAAGFLVFASPIVGWDGTSAYVDVAAATVLFALFYLIQVWESGAEPKLLILIGVLAGFSYAVKYTAAIAIPYALGSAAWVLWRSRKPLWKPLITIGAIAAIFVLPWMCKDVVQFGNPFAPFGNHLFPNPYVHVSFERGYLEYLRHYHLTSWAAAPWALTVKGERLQGFFGPVFLLMPLALLSFRRMAGRRLMLAGAIFALPWFLNVGSRFLIPALPLFALALALALEQPRWLLPCLVAVHGFLSWYASPARYFDQYAPRIVTLPVRAALRIEPERSYLARNNSGYRIDRLIEQLVPPGSKVFSFEPIPESWTTRAIVAGQNAAENEVLGDFLRTALVLVACPTQSLDFRFAPVSLRRIRAVQMSRHPEQMWSVSEFQVLEAGKPLAMDSKWRLTAHPNPWDVRRAFDGSLLTRWRSWAATAPGMFLDVDFTDEKLVDEVILAGSSESWQHDISLRGMDPSGRWLELSGQHAVASLHVTGNPRAEAICQMTSHGIDYLLVTPGAFGANDFYQNAAEWGIRAIGESDGARLYRLDSPVPQPPASRAVSDETVAPPGVYDDTEPRLCLREPWTRDPQFQDAYRHTLTYSNIPGASISLAFRGDAITFVYTGAANRGIAEVWLDNQLKDRVDLYAADTRWGSRRKYCGLGSRKHIIEIRVSGERNPQATDSFVDLDALIVE